MTHPDMMYKLVEAHQEDLRKEAAAHNLAKQVQGQQANHAKALFNTVVAFAKRVGAKNVETSQTAEIPQIKLSSEQA